MKVKFEPFGDRLLIKRADPTSQTAGGIHLLDETIERPFEGTVMAVGPGYRQPDGSIRPLGVKEGDRVIFGQFSGAPVQINDQDFLLMREDDCMGKLTEVPDIVIVSG